MRGGSFGQRTVGWLLATTRISPNRRAGEKREPTRPSSTFVSTVFSEPMFYEVSARNLRETFTRSYVSIFENYETMRV